MHIYVYPNSSCQSIDSNQADPCSHFSKVLDMLKYPHLTTNRCVDLFLMIAFGLQPLLYLDLRVTEFEDAFSFVLFTKNLDALFIDNGRYPSSISPIRMSPTSIVLADTHHLSNLYAHRKHTFKNHPPLISLISTNVNSTGQRIEASRRTDPDVVEYTLKMGPQVELVYKASHNKHALVALPHLITGYHATNIPQLSIFPTSCMIHMTQLPRIVLNIKVRRLQ
ncbi:hypothetical protein KP509_1Z233800 [Ceratopteris richardii]|nr:hypothetical protein KP509_1Z233800 [Ceratopteris richardii]